MKIKRILVWILVGMIACGLTILPPSYLSGETPLRKAVLALQWLPQAQFAGYMVGYEKGFYESRGIDLSLLFGGPSASPTERLQQGQADFATLWLTNAVQLRGDGVPILGIAQILQRSGLMLISHKSSGIDSPEKMNGKKVGIWGADFAIPPRAFFEIYGVQVEEIPQSSSMNLFLRGGTDVASAMWYNEYHLVLNSGINPDELNTFFFDQYQVNFPEDGIYCMEETWNNDPQFCTAFVQASLEGWRYAFSNPEEALDIIMKYCEKAHTGTNRVHQKWMLERIQDLTKAPDREVPLGLLRESDFFFVAYRLWRSGMMPNLPEYKDFYRNVSTGAESP